MSQQVMSGRVPEVTLGWRLKIALGEMGAQQMADALGVTRSTVSRWMNDKGAPPRRGFVLQWAMLTKVDPEWLLNGSVQGSPDGDGGGWAPWDSNPQPAGYTRRSRPRWDRLTQIVAFDSPTLAALKAA